MPLSMRKPIAFIAMILVLAWGLAGCSPPNPNRTVYFALPALESPESNAIVFSVTPPLRPPSQNKDALFDDPVVVPIGYLRAMRSLPLSDRAITELPAGAYLVWVTDGQVGFTDAAGKVFAPTSLKADTRYLERDVDPPEAIITLQDICFSWRHVQVCTEPVPLAALSESEIAAIRHRMQSAVDALVESEFIEAQEIDIEGTLPDMMGSIAADLKQASLLAAPTREYPSSAGPKPVEGALLGVIEVLLPIDLPGDRTLQPGSYAVHAVMPRKGEWAGLFQRPDRTKAVIPAQEIEVRGQIEKPMAIIAGIWIGLCWDCW